MFAHWSKISTFQDVVWLNMRCSESLCFDCTNEFFGDFVLLCLDEQFLDANFRQVIEGMVDSIAGSHPGVAVCDLNLSSV